MESPPDKNLNLLNIQEDKKNEEENKEKENINTQIIVKNNSSELTKSKRRNSLDFNTFKINSKNDIANIIPKIYNNISENAIIPKIKNNSMKKLRPKIINEMTIETKKENKKINERNDYIFKSIIKIRKETSRPQLLDEQWYYEKILLDYNIIDFTCKINNYKIIFFL
jgi:hypothetical protein